MMRADRIDQRKHRLQLKEKAGWFPAGEAFLKAMALLADGPFKLFVFLCLNADRHTATYTSSCQRLATSIGKSRHTVEAYIADLKAKGFCSAVTSRVPYFGTTFRINDDYWPYRQSSNSTQENTGSSYVDSVRRAFLALGCTHGRFGRSEERQALDFKRRGVSLTTVEDAMLVGACRKYVSWMNDGTGDPISSLRYFESLIEEVQERPFPAGYRQYMRLELQKLSDLWERKQSSMKPGARFKSGELTEKETG